MENIRLTEVRVKRGFTLMELLIVIAIIAILISLGVVSYSSAQKTSRDSKRKADVKAIQNAWEQYYADNSGSYPSSCSVSTAYLPAGLPKDPKTQASYTSACSASSYCFCAQLEGAGGGNASASNCTYASGTFFCVSNLQ